MRFIVGYTDTPAGKDALALGVRLARARGARLEIVLVLASESRATLVPAAPSYDRHVRELAESWLAGAAARVPDGVDADTHVVYAESLAEGLLDTSKRLEGSMIVVGGASNGLRHRYTIGSVPRALLHSAVVPVALAPRGIRKLETSGITRVTCAIGRRPGADRLLDAAVAAASSARVPLRLLSLVAVDLPADASDEALAAAEEHATTVLDYATRHLPEGIDADVVIASGSRVQDAVASVSWDPEEVVFVGSSRLAASGHLFLGTTAAKMLRELPVPMIVVPRDSVITIEG
ncbi:universal stress protein [Labedella endophytica]|uniref:Universal stress protein n=1 Tax=Labedella endophytica TaxID=1523160 RepID=A0A3S0X108_9MICO|nr:universal stress protein [Labedella endophytica]RUR03376.1 universal stress protein [Labedella endophytica]